MYLNSVNFDAFNFEFITKNKNNFSFFSWFYHVGI